MGETATDTTPLISDAGQVAERLPALLLAADRLSSALTTGTHGRRRAGPGETFWQYRDYQQTDPAAQIDWRQSARMPDRLFVRQTEWETAATVGVWCDGGPGFDYQSEDRAPKRWEGYVLATALSMLLLRAGERVRCLFPHGAERVKSAQGLAEGLLRQSEAIALPPASDQRVAHLIYISDFHVPLDNLSDRLSAIGATGASVHLVRLEDPYEETFPFDGARSFRGLGKDSRAIQIGNPSGVRADYLAARGAHIEALTAICQGHGYRLYHHRTHLPILPVLTSLFASLSQDDRSGAPHP